MRERMTITSGLIGMLMILVMFITPIQTVEAVYPEELMVEDPAFLTARLDIEKLLSKGKEAVGKGIYVWGGGHRNKGTDYVFPYTALDCSGFVGGTFLHGLGIHMTAAYGAPTTYDYHEAPFDKYVRDSVSIEEAERGDVIINRKNDHMVFYLGEDEQGNHVVLDSSANGSLPDDAEIGDIAPLGGVAMRQMVEADYEIDAIFNTKLFIDAGYGDAWIDGQSTKLEQQTLFDYIEGGERACDFWS